MENEVYNAKLNGKYSNINISAIKHRIKGVY